VAAPAEDDESVGGVPVSLSQNQAFHTQVLHSTNGCGYDVAGNAAEKPHLGPKESHQHIYLQGLGLGFRV
jgi:hypothetical protein